MTSEEEGEMVGEVEGTRDMSGEVDKELVDELKTSYLNYSMSVIVGRALPDARDGLKPVHRRILHGMNEGGMVAGKPYKKSGRIVGDVLGKYHPHGDSAIYDSLVRMAQPFSLRYPLVDGQGNFGSLDGDSAAAMRYTESRTTRIAMEMLEDIQKDTVDFIPNYDGSLSEPTVMPSKIPNLLLNGSSGIAVGMATNMAPHNLNEVADGLKALISDPTLDTFALMDYVKAPDFPTGGTIHGTLGVYEAYDTGRGKVRIRANTHFEGKEGEKRRIVVNEIPYMVNKARMLEKIAELVKAKVIDGITDLRDESDKDGLRVVFELRRDVVPEVILNQLYTNSDLQSNFNIINLAIVNGQPRVLTLKEMLKIFIDHRQNVIRRKTTFDLEKARDRLHIIEGLIIALDNLDEVIRIIRSSKDPETARNKLMRNFSLSEKQSKAILDLKLQKLTSMESDSIRKEGDDLKVTIIDLEDILANASRVDAIIVEELDYIKDKYGDDRRTLIEENAEEIDLEDLIQERNVVITITNTGYIKRLDLDTYRTQHRGGKGLKGMKVKEEDHVVDMFICSTHDYILFFTSHGRVFWMKGYNIPSGSRQSRGKALINLLPNLEEGEVVKSNIVVSEFRDDQYIVFATRRGIIKKTCLEAYSRPRSTGIRAILLGEKDELVDACLTDGQSEIFLATALGMANRFSEKDVRSIGRSTYGVRGIRLKGPKDKVVSMTTIPACPEEVEVVDEDEELDEEENGGEGEVLNGSGGPIVLTITGRGFGKRAYAYNYRLTRRGSAGVINIRKSALDETGKAVRLMTEEPGSELLLTSRGGMVIRTQTSTIRLVNRVGKGVRVMRLEPEDRVIAVAMISPVFLKDEGGEEAGECGIKGQESEEPTGAEEAGGESLEE